MRNLRAAAVGLIASVMAAIYGALVSSQLQLIDHIGFQGTVARMRSGQGYYSAYIDAFVDTSGVEIGHARGVRIPTIFLVWRWIPDDGLYVTYVLVVVVLTAVLLALAVPDRPFAALAPAAYLLIAGRSLDQPHVDAWLMCELWAVPALAGGILAWQRGRDRTAVACVVVAVLIREIAALALVIGFLVALVERRAKAPWLIGAVVAISVWGMHTEMAANAVSGSGSGVAPLAGTARFPRTILEMMAWNMPQPTALFALTAFGGAAFTLWRRRNLLIAAMTLPLPTVGLFVARSYWGMLAVPFAWWLTAIAVGDIVRPPGMRGPKWAIGTMPLPSSRSYGGVDHEE